MSDCGAKSADKIDVTYVARLARLHLTEQEIRTFQGQLEQIVGYVRQINELDLADVEPTSHVRPLRNVWRRDDPAAGLDREAALNSAPASSNGLFIVPKIVE